MMTWIEVFKFWYPLPVELPDEILVQIYDYCFNPFPLQDPW